MKNTIKTIAIVSILVFTSFSWSDQEPEVIYHKQMAKVFTSQEFVYYGLDFSQFRLLNHKKLDENQLIKVKYIPAWINKFDERFDQKKIKSQLNVKVVFDKRKKFQSDQYKKNDVENTVSMYAPEITLEDVSKIVSEYNLDEKNGIGVSLIISTFEKNTKMVHGYVSFFNIETRDLLYVVKIKGKGGAKGMTSFWYAGMEEAWNDFITFAYSTYRFSG